MTKRDARRGRDLLTLGLAVLLLLTAVLAWYAWSARARERRDAVLAGVPEFPHPGQLPHPRLPPAPRAILPGPRPAPRPAPGPARAPLPAGDRLAAFALAPAHNVAVVQVNAILNSPLFARLRECAPQEFRDLETHTRELGVELDRDIDRVAMVQGGFAMSGFFDGKPVAEKLAGLRGGSDGASADVRDYRDQKIYQVGGSCIAQLPNLLIIGGAAGCEPLIDRALSPAPDAAAQSELYGDIYVRSDLSGLNTQDQAGPVGDLLKALDGATVRANVWDEVALSVDGAPASGQSSTQLAAMARGALSVARGQIGEDDVELQTLAQLAKVSGKDGRLQVDLAVPADTLFDRLHIPCEGRADGGTTAAR